jgi:integrase
MGRRANGEGTVSRRKDGLWEGKAYVLLPDGGRKRRTVYGRTRREANEKLQVLLTQARQGVPAPVVGMTVEAYLNGWLAEVARRRLRPSTFTTYELMVRRHIVPTLGRKRLDRLSAPDVRRLVNAKADEGLSANSVRHVHAVLRSALEQAVRDDLLARNVARLVQVPSARTEPVQPFDVDEARQLLAAAEGDRLHALWTVALGIGLRKGEALGLRWIDVDLDGGWLHVRQSLQRQAPKEGAVRAGSLVLVAPKTQRSVRKVPLPPVCASALRAHRRRQVAERLEAGPYWQDTGLVFTTTLGTPIDPRNVNRWFDQLCERAGVRRLRVHDLRHTCASLLLAQGVPARVVMEVLGHSQISVTMDLYTHVLPGVQQVAAAEMERAIGPVVTPDVVDGPDGDAPSTGRST